MKYFFENVRWSLKKSASRKYEETERESCDVKYASSVVDVICSWGRRRARAKLGGMFSAACVFRALPRRMFSAFAPSNRDRKPCVQRAFDPHRRMGRQEKVLG